MVYSHQPSVILFAQAMLKTIKMLKEKIENLEQLTLFSGAIIIRQTNN